MAFNILDKLGDINNFVSFRGEFYNELKIFFKDHQKALLWFFNTKIGKWYGGITHKEKVTKITPNAYHIKVGKGKYKLIARTYPVYAIKVYQLLKYVPVIAIGTAMRPLLPYALALTTTNFYSGAGDGVCYQEAVETWDSARAQSSSNYVFDNTSGPVQFIQSWTSGSYHPIRRAFFPTDTSSLGASATISAAVMKIYGAGTIANTDSTSGYMVQTTQASTSALVAGDYSKTGSTDGGNFTYAGWNTSGYNSITLNATGRGWINKTGYTMLGVRDGLDFNNTGPTAGNNSIVCYFSGETGTSKDPYLEVTYVNNYTASVGSSLSISDIINRQSQFDYSRSIISAITLIDNIGIANQISRGLASALTLTDVGVNTAIILSVYLQDSLSIADSLDVVKQINRDLTSNLALTDLVTPSVQYNRASTDALTLTDSLDFTFIVQRALSDAITLADNINRVTTIIGKSIARLEEVENIKPKLYKIDRDKPILYSIRKG